MRMRTSVVAASLAAGLVSPVAFAAQHQDHQPAAGQSPMSAESVQCARAQPLITGTVNAAMARLETARQANSPSQMRAAIDDLQGALRDVRAQLAPCASMQPAAGAPGGHLMPMTPAAPGAKPSDPPMDHSTMQMGSPPAAKPVRGVKAEALAAPMDHSKMSMGTPPKASAQAVDPVCGLKVDPATAPQAEHQGHTYSFCSEQHRQFFQKNPTKYLPKGQ